MSTAVRRTVFALAAAVCVLLALALFSSPSADAAVSAPVVKSKYFTGGEVKISCPSGMVATGGGVGADLRESMYVARTEPTRNSAGKPIGWKADVRTRNGAAGSGTVYVVCAR